MRCDHEGTTRARRLVHVLAARARRLVHEVATRARRQFSLTTNKGHHVYHQHRLPSPSAILTGKHVLAHKTAEQIECYTILAKIDGVLPGEYLYA